VAAPPGLIPALVGALGCPCSAAQSSAAAALCSMTAEAKEEVWGAGALAPLLHIMREVGDAMAKKDAVALPLPASPWPRNTAVQSRRCVPHFSPPIPSSPPWPLPHLSSLIPTGGQSHRRSGLL